ncbi:MAG TPA: AAA family ATPase, partial [Cytophagaceae bacterium]|nr:AAA family ATPase [Cytophagaceae bacterium]
MQNHIHGARWWKVDFHNHTPASSDYGKGPNQTALMAIDPKDWLLNYMRAEIDCVVISDHNSGAWIDILKNALTELETTQPAGYRKIYLFPGVEITANNNVHILAIFGLDSSTSTISSLLGSVNFPTGSFGTSDAVSPRTVEEIITTIIENGGIPIPAHVDKPSGLFVNLSQGHTLKQIFEKHNLLAIELIDKTYVKPDIYSQMKLSLAEVVGTDSHLPAHVGTNYTWVKMEEPSLDALRLALHDGEDGVIRKDDLIDDPNSITNRFFIKKISISKAYKAGNGTPMEVKFSPWLTSIIGGRGSGKSTIINFLRIILNKKEEIPEKIKEDFDKFNSVGDRNKSGMLRTDTEIILEIIKDNIHHKLTWSNTTSSFHLERYNTISHSWTSQGNITNVTDLFPVQLFSQKELYELTQNPNKLLELIDSQFDKRGWNEQLERYLSNWLQIRKSVRDLSKNISSEHNTSAELANLKAKIKVYEDSGNRDTLSNFNKSNSVKTLIDTNVKEVAEYHESLKNKKEIFPLFKISDEILAELDEKSKEYYKNVTEQLNSANKDFINALTKLEEVKNNFSTKTEALPWEELYSTRKAAYDALSDQLKSIGSETYEQLLKRKDELEDKLSKIESFKTYQEELKTKRQELYNLIITHYKELHNKRRAIVEVWKNHPGAATLSLSIELDLMGNMQNAEESFRALIRKSGNEFEKFILKEEEQAEDCSGLIYDLATSTEDKWNLREELLRNFISATDADPKGFDRRLAKHIENLRNSTPEDLDRLLVWVPEDKIILKFNKDGVQQDIETGSAGERTAGMLALLMALNECPLIIDQPEDDLDTRLISAFVVESFKALKKNRQLIIVTHNPNITVNATSETIIEMSYNSGQIVVKNSGALQMVNIRKAVCEVMEGGETALNKRYFRISKA